MPLRAARFLASIGAFVIALPLIVQGAEPTLPPTEEATAMAPADRPPPPTQISLLQIVERADEDERYAEQVLAVASYASSTAHKQLASRLQQIDTSTDKHRRDFRYDDLKLLPAPRLESLERYWRFEARRFEALQHDLREASQPYTQSASELARRLGDWEVTRKALAQGALPPALVERTDDVMRQLHQAIQTLSGPLEQQLALARRANAVEARINAGLASVASAIEYSDRRLARIDSPPLWASRRSQRDADPLVNTRLGMKIETDFLGEYRNSSFGNQRLVQLLEVLLLPLLLWVWWQRRHHSVIGPVPLNPASSRVLERPLSTWLLLSMLAAMVLEPDAPLLLQQFAMLLALLPVLRLLPPQSRVILGPWPLVVSALYLANRLGFLLLGDLFLFRWFHFALTLAAMGAMAWLGWHARRIPAEVASDWPVTSLRSAAWLAVLALTVAATSNLVGNLTLAEMLTGSLVDSAYMALVLYAGFAVFIALLGESLSRSQGSGLRSLRNHAPRIMAFASRGAAWAAMAGWMFYAANRFRVYRPTRDLVEGVVTARFQFGEINLSLGSLLVFVLAVLLAVVLARSTRFLLREQILPNMSLPRGVDNSVASLTYYALLFVGLLAALAAAGLQLSQLSFLFGAMGVGIGLGLQDVIKNFVSGLILMFERPVQPGDIIDVSGTSGRISDIGMRATTIRTFDGADVVMPNGILLADKFTNWTLRDQHRRIDIDVGVAYGSDPDRVAALLLDVVKRTPGVAEAPPSVVLFSGFGASSLDFSVRAWTHDADEWPTLRSQLATRLYAALVDAGIEIPYPQQDLHLRSVSDNVARQLRGPLAPGTDPDPGSPAT
jgi:small-conductance mechanosensitive channel